tara:strand:+ start:900 stop:1361 length:462 start_codon:yes stop_codon:yes gene_type:complete
MRKYIKKKISIKKVRVGKNVKIYNPSNIYECEIGDNSIIGPFVEIQKGVKIGKDTKIQSHTFICEFVKIKNNVFIGHSVVFINDKFQKGGPAKGNKKLWKKTLINDNVSIGSNSTILPVSICSNVVIGAGSVVTKDINYSGVYAGNPAVKLKK